MSKFYVVATPIGNLGDITLRAIETLKDVDLILCEDTRETKKILDKYGIVKPTMGYHAQSKLSKTDKIFELLEEGKNLALVSDAGTPGISDPGALLVSKIKEYLSDSVDVIPIPGPSAIIAALSASGLPTHEFTFLGFLPHKKGRQTAIKAIAKSEIPVVLYESPHRILKLLNELENVAPKSRVTIARELTKIHEEVLQGMPRELVQALEKGKKARGEFVVIVSKL